MEQYNTTKSKVKALEQEHTLRVARDNAFDAFICTVKDMDQIQQSAEMTIETAQSHLETGIELTAEQVEKIEKYNPCFKERHVESSRPGELLCQDTMFVGNLKGVGKVYLHACIDTLWLLCFWLSSHGEKARMRRCSRS